MKSVTVNTNDASQRLDKFLGKYFKTMPKSLIYKGIRKKRIKINGKRAEIDYILKEGDVARCSCTVGYLRNILGC